MESIGWYGVVFSLEASAEDALNKLSAGHGTDYDLLRCNLLLDISKALRAGLERQHDYDSSDRKNWTMAQRMAYDYAREKK